MTDVTNGLSEQIKAGTVLPRACEIWLLPNQGPADSGPTTTANIYGHDGTNRKTTGEGAGLRKQLVRRIVGVKRADKRRMDNWKWRLD